MTYNKKIRRKERKGDDAKRGGLVGHRKNKKKINISSLYSFHSSFFLSLFRFIFFSPLSFPAIFSLFLIIVPQPKIGTIVFLINQSTTQHRFLFFSLIYPNFSIINFFQMQSLSPSIYLLACFFFSTYYHFISM